MSRASWAGASALVSGTLFGLGLAIAGMTDPRKVLAFLDVVCGWDPSLLLVLGTAVLVTLPGYRWARRQKAPLLADRFHLPAASAIDTPLVLGAALFGIGWGIAGYCPGPAIVGLAFGNSELRLFLPAMLLGIALARWQRALQQRRLVAQGQG